MKFRYIPKKEGAHNVYRQVATYGDILEFDRHFSAKAMNNPDFEQYVEPVKAEVKPEVKAEPVKKKTTRKKRTSKVNGD
tara:strand:- start:40 stop:276 length:237 start_codon:yes stop_codon:yes gene_type:complete